MIIKICDRCGAPLPPAERAGFKPQDGRIRVNGSELCGECAAEFEEFMQGAAVLKWNPIKVRPMTDEEKDELTEWSYTPEQISELTVLDDENWESMRRLIEACTAGAMAIQRVIREDFGESEDKE